jgi:ABC-type phosphate transport system substrate-binding protein
MIQRKLTIVFSMLLLLSFSTLCAAESYVVIVNNANTDHEILAKDLKKIFLGEKSAWPNGKQIKVAALKGGDSEAHKDFLKDIVKITPLNFRMHWKRKVFTGAGAGTDIQFFTSEKKLKEFIAANPTAVGYISTASLDDTVKKARILK